MQISGFENKDYRNGFDEGYDKGRADAYAEVVELCENDVTMDNICESLSLENKWCAQYCSGGFTVKCLAKYVEQLKENDNGN